MDGFFDRKDTRSKARPDGKRYSCVSCGLYKQCKSPKMEPFGNFKKGILNIGEAPGAREDARGKPWQGKTGRLLEKVYKELGIDLFEDCLNINAVHCRPVDSKGENRKPSNYEIDCCRKSTIQIIEKYQPKVIIALGASSIYSLFNHRWKKDLGGIMKWRGWTIPDQDFEAWICPVFHPSYVERSEREVMTIWRQDLEQALDLVNVDFPLHKKPKIEYIDDLSVLSSIKTDQVSFDYETTGLKPYATGHKIICASVAISDRHVYSFMMPANRRDQRPFINLLQSSTIGKIAHNIKFEDTWTTVRLRTEIKGWDWDSMQAAHILDNRPGITGLKFQTYVNFGIIDYDSGIEPYLKAPDSNDFNKTEELIQAKDGQRKLLKYCALDSIFGYRLAKKQIDMIGYDFLPF